VLRARLTRSVPFFALHYLFRPDWSEEQNRAVFGPLCDPAGHGHDYVATVTVSGPLRHNMVMDLGELDRLLDAIVVRGLRGKLLNRDVPEFAGDRLPTCEGLAAWIYQRLLPQLPVEVSLDVVRVSEDATLSGEVAPG
jgi:6-pyruvoyltetrahydropterin/6-carboxytetrahydropterin synthase